MRAIRIHGEEDVRLEELPDPEVEPGKVLLRGGFSGICGSDLHLYYAPDSLPFDFDEPAELTGATWPQILGHEFSGTVAEIGEGVTHLQVGDRVAVFPYHFCGECPACQRGDTTNCVKMAFEGIQGRSGGMAELKLVDGEDCFVLPEGASLEMGALVEPLAVSHHGVVLAQPEDARSALISGGGPIGVGAYFGLKRFGVDTIIVSEPSAERRAVLERIGVEHVIDPTSQDLVEEVRARTDGGGVDISLECSGAPVAFETGLAALGLYGRMVVLALYEERSTIDPSGDLMGGKTVQMSSVYTREDFDAVIDGIGEGAYTMEGGWVETVPLEGAEDAIHQLRRGEGMKILISAEPN